MSEGAMMVTGAASGIGRELGRALREKGVRVVLADIDDARLRTVAVEDGHAAEHTELAALDVRDPAAWERVVARAVERFGALDVLFNVAGCLKPGWVHEIDDADVALMIDVNVKGVMFGTRAAARHMVPLGRGHIVNVASMAAIVAVPGIAVYCASKHAVRGYSIAAAQELRPRGVHVTVLCPAAVQTPMLDLQLDYDEAAMTFSGERVLTTSEVVRALVDRVLVERPVELLLPIPGSGQALLAKLAGAFPDLVLKLGPRITRIGLRNQKKIRAARR